MKYVQLFSGVLVLAFLTACKPTGSIKVGFIGPLTGDAATFGTDTLHGVQLKIEEVNAAGGIGGRMLELVAEDGRCAGGDAANAAQKLVNVDKVVVIVGGDCSGETLAAAPIAEAGGVVMISPLSSSPDVAQAGDFIFRDYPNDLLKAKAVAQFFAEEELSRVAIITENVDFTVAFRDALKKDVPEGALVFDEVVDPGTKDYRSLMTRLQDMEFDAFFANGTSTATIGAMMQQLREQGFAQTAMTHDAGQDKSVIDIGGEAVAGLYAINVPSVNEDSPFGQKVAERFGGTQAGMAFVSHSYDAMGVLAEAMQAVGTEGTAIRDYLYNLSSYSGIVGNFSFDENGDVIGIPLVLWQVQSGAYVKVKDISVN